MDKHIRCQKVAELVMNERELKKIGKQELEKFLNRNNATDDLIDRILAKRRRAKGRDYTEGTRRRSKELFIKLQNEKDYLRIEKQTLQAEIHLFEDLLKN